MNIFNNINDVPGDFAGAVVTIGNFDGVHRGHQHIFHEVLKEARRLKRKSMVITFEPHPKMVLHPERKPFYLITSLEEKISRIAEAGIDGLLLIPFSLEFSRIKALEFVHLILWDKLRIGKIFIGHDYTFGQGREGNEDFLIKTGEQLGFSVQVLGPFKIGDVVISSTLTRNLILAGHVREAAEYLGRPYNLGGKVIVGHRRGRSLGFPTANMRPDKELIPARGIYAVRLLLGKRTLEGVVNIGFNPTFSHNTLSVEAHIFDFADDIYGRRLEALFVERIRDERKFDGPDQLVAQIRRDVEAARDILKHEAAETAVT